MTPTDRKTPIPIPMEDPIIHTNEHPTCNDPTCPCQSEQAESVTYIATDIERGQWLAVQVLASNARSPQAVGRYKTVEECKRAVESFGQVTWVTPYRFQKEATCD